MKYSYPLRRNGFEGKLSRELEQLVIIQDTDITESTVMNNGAEVKTEFLYENDTDHVVTGVPFQNNTEYYLPPNNFDMERSQDEKMAAGQVKKPARVFVIATLCLVAFALLTVFSLRNILIRDDDSNDSSSSKKKDRKQHHGKRFRAFDFRRK